MLPQKRRSSIDIRQKPHFVPVAIETGGAWDIEAIEFIEILGKRITTVTNKPMETQYLFQRISIAI